MSRIPNNDESIPAIARRLDWEREVVRSLASSGTVTVSISVLNSSLHISSFSDVDAMCDCCSML
jgi:hypothetical protein